MTQDTEDVVARLAAWSNDPDDEPPIVLMMAAKSELQSLSDRIDVLEGALRQIHEGADRGLAQFNERQNGRCSPIWRSVNVLQDNLAACYGTALSALIKIDDARAALHQEGISAK